MTRSEYMKNALEALDSGRITEEVYDCMVMNADVFCDEDEDRDERFPEGYAEIEYEDMDSPEAIMGSRFDDMNFLRYYER